MSPRARGGGVPGEQAPGPLCAVGLVEELDLSLKHGGDREDPGL